MRGLSVVVPTLDESVRLPLLLDDLAHLGELVDEVIVVDGGSGDRTVEIARARGARVLHTPPGRGGQLRAGGWAARAPWIFFVHADCRLPVAAADALRRFLRHASVTDFAHFGFALEGGGRFFRALEAGQRLRERWWGLPYGDQGLVVSRALYDRVGGHPAWPVMEDVGIMDALRERGRRVPLPAVLPTSGRRYAREGALRAWARNLALLARFRLGAAPARLARWYRPESSRSGGADTAVAVFAKAPEPGRVKTRLAADVGPEEAVRIYRTIGAETVDAVRRGPWETVIYVAPPTREAIATVRRWLRAPGLVYRPQLPGDLGARMLAAVEECLHRASAVVVVGTDIPGLDADTIRAARALLEEAEVVVGPATDGGYYLIGMRTPHADLFRDIPWSTGEVLERTREAAERAGLSLRLLEPKTDVDTVDDVPASYRTE